MMKRRGPIRRKAGERKREHDERQHPPAPVEPPEAPSASEEAPTPPPPAAPARRVHAPIGRRVFEPGERKHGPRLGGERPAAAGPPPAEGAARPAPKERAPAVTPAAPPTTQRASAKAAEQEEAKELAKDKGIPLVHALRVTRGEVSLNDVLKALMRKERAQRLIERDGLDPGLAGQVASGHLSRERALLIQRIRQHRTHRIDRDVVKVAEVDELVVAVKAFGQPWVPGRVTEARTYEFDFRPEGPEGTPIPAITIQKHDIKAVCLVEQLPAVTAAEGRSEEVVGLELGGTADREERVRPSDERMMEILEAGEAVECVLRDGDVYRGRLRSFGRWDLDLEVAEGVVVTLLFHALHPAPPWVQSAGS